MNKVLLNKLKEVINQHREIKLVYFFGSKSENNDGPLSDYDLAFYLDKRDAQKIYDLKFKLFDKISRILKTDKLDIVMLNAVKAPELKYDIIKNGRLIYEKEPYKVLFEPKVLNEYFDFMIMLRKYNLTKA